MQFLSRPLIEVAFDLEMYRADLEAQAIELEKARVRQGAGR